MQPSQKLQFHGDNFSISISNRLQRHESFNKNEGTSEEIKRNTDNETIEDSQ